MSGMSAAGRSHPYLPPPPPPPPMEDNAVYTQFAYFINGERFGIRLFEEDRKISFFNRNGEWSARHGRWVCDYHTGQIFMVFQHSAGHHLHACAVAIDWTGEMEFTGWDYLLRRIKMVPVYGRMADHYEVLDKREICLLTLHEMNRFSGDLMLDV